MESRVRCGHGTPGVSLSNQFKFTHSQAPHVLGAQAQMRTSPSLLLSSFVMVTRESSTARAPATPAWHDSIHLRQSVWSPPRQVPDPCPGPVPCLCQREQLFALSRDGNIDCLDVSTGTTLSKWDIHSSDDPWFIALASNGTFLAVSANSSPADRAEILIKPIVDELVGICSGWCLQGIVRTSHGIGLDNRARRLSSSTHHLIEVTRGGIRT